MTKQPMQPLVRVKDVVRFQQNALVVHLLDQGGLDMNALARVPGISRADREQFAQLIGYSVNGFDSLSYVRKKTRSKLFKRVEAFLDQEANP